MGGGFNNDSLKGVEGKKMFLITSHQYVTFPHDRHFQNLVVGVVRNGFEISRRV